MRPAGKYLGIILTSGSKLDSPLTADHGRDADGGRFWEWRMPERYTRYGSSCLYCRWDILSPQKQCTYAFAKTSDVYLALTGVF